MSRTASPERHVCFQFAAPTGVDEKEPRRFRDGLSAVEFLDEGRTLFVGTDETINAEPTIERLSLVGDSYTHHQPLKIQDYVSLPDETVKKGRVSEVDIEGVALDHSYLWIVGSHSCKRKKPKNRSIEDDLQRLATVDLDPNRVLLARIPVVHGPDGSTLAKRVDDRCAAQLTADLREVLSDDALLGPFLKTFKNADGKRVSIPGKDNGFDIEGLVVKPESDGVTRVLLGLRGPVSRGWATIVEVALIEGRKPGELVLGPIDADDERTYCKHVLHLEGRGIRDMRAHGDDLLILAGPTLTLNGEIALYRWVGGLGEMRRDSVTPLCPGRLERLLTLPYGDGEDRPEGFTVLPSGEILVVYDAPAEGRLRGEHAVLADVFAVNLG